jgi:hypothetical protein
MKLRVLVAAGLLAGLLVAGCSSDSSDSGSGTTKTTSSREAVCAASAKLQKSVQQLVDPATLTGGKSGVTAGFQAVKSDLDALGAAAKRDLKPDVTAVRDAIDQLETAVEDLRSSSVSEGISEGIPNVGNAANQVGGAVSNLTAALRPGCSS